MIPDSPSELAALADRMHERAMKQERGGFTREGSAIASLCTFIDECAEELRTRAAAQPQGVWLSIDSAPEVKGDCFWCQLAWGPEGDQSTSYGFRWDGKWYAAGCFYQLGQERKFGWREIEIKPTHWMPKTPPPAELGKGS